MTRKPTAPADGSSGGQADEFLRRAAPQPEALAAFATWTDELEDRLPFRLGKAVAVTVATRTGSDYMRVEHERIALAGGMTREELVALERGRADSCKTLSEAEVAASALARCLLADFGRGCEPALLRLGRLVGEPTAVACLMLAARQIAHSAMANAWSLDPPEELRLASDTREQRSDL